MGATKQLFIEQENLKQEIREMLEDLLDVYSAKIVWDEMNRLREELLRV